MSRLRKFIFALLLQQLFYILIFLIYWWLTRRPKSDLVIVFPRQDQPLASPVQSEEVPKSNEFISREKMHSDISSTEATPIDDLKKISGVGPKIAALLHQQQIYTFEQLAGQSLKQLETYLREAGLPFSNPESWPAQARLASSGAWDALAKLQDSLKRK